ncbi:uncharacterized protein J3R85_006959 [Psidium guajava]|nr:uncharacterized protein J3R85_006959 [Psidium guajava]
MPSIVPASPMTRYGAPVDFSTIWEDHIDQTFREFQFKKLVSVSMVDVGLVTSPIPYRFIAMYMRSFDGCSVGPLPLAPNSGDGGIGGDLK